jgi:hypothetical protein
LSLCVHPKKQRVVSWFAPARPTSAVRRDISVETECKTKSSPVGAAYSDDVAPERSLEIFDSDFLQRCQPYGLKICVPSVFICGQKKRRGVGLRIRSSARLSQRDEFLKLLPPARVYGIFAV